MSTHALLSPSSAHRWMRCPASVTLEAGVKDDLVNHPAEGTAAHFLAEKCLVDDATMSEFGGKYVLVDAQGECLIADAPDKTGRLAIPVDAEMVSAVQGYVDRVETYRNVADLDAIEKKLPIGHITGEKGAMGTADAVIIDGPMLRIIDLKYGYVEVDAENNEQLMLYALGALHITEAFGFIEFGYRAIDNVCLVIDQPRKNHYSEWWVTPKELQEFAEKVKKAADRTRQIPVVAEPSPKACQWCKAKATCKALAEYNLKAITGEFIDLTQRVPKITPDLKHTQLATLYANADLVEDWVKAIRKAAYAALINGRPVDGYKLVTGRKGKRKWSDADKAAKAMAGLGVGEEELYKRTLISPTQAQKALGKEGYKKIENLVTQPAGSPAIVPISDKRPALEVQDPADDFDNLNVA